MAQDVQTQNHVERRVMLKVGGVTIEAVTGCALSETPRHLAIVKDGKHLFQINLTEEQELRPFRKFLADLQALLPTPEQPSYLTFVRTAGGAEVTCTPNHPILTDHGWVAAGQLKKGQQPEPTKPTGR